MKKAAGFGCMALLFLVGRAFAQAAQAGTDHSDIRIVSSFVAPGRPIPADCSAQAHGFAESLVRYPRPNSPHWVLVCDEAGWRRFLRLSGRGEDELIYASTDLTARTTYLRGARLFRSGDFGVEANHVLTHELAHIWLDSGDELKAEALSRAWSRNGDGLDRGIIRAKSPLN